MSADLDLDLGTLDRDGAVRAGLDAIGDRDGATRAGLLRVGGAGLVALLAGPSAVAAAATTAAATRHDRAILNYALTLEYLQASFYSEVERLGSVRGALGHQARVVGTHERAHVRAFRVALGRHAVGRPRFDFRGATEDDDRFQKTAVAFEDLAVAAYAAQAPRIRSRPYLASALAIASVEARHAAWIRRLAGVVPAPDAFDEPRSRAATIAIVDKTHFAVHTTSRRRPRFTG
ncbi:ferritin-like domain-containing protein [Conexibacter woesei]|uniref:ferritin-like domain-containing protein n=1 Tax=Conexibacter woesei TaxID=191495 RepID=UPI0004112B54|nr:ferritin-like domain-containing protein [Conexibacter woesei]